MDEQLNATLGEGQLDNPGVDAQPETNNTQPDSNAAPATPASQGETQQEQTGHTVPYTRLHEVISERNALRAEIEQLKSQQQQPGQYQPQLQQQYQQLPKELEGLNIDPDTGLVEYQGNWVDKQTAIDNIQLRNQIKELSDWRNGLLEQQQQAAIAAQAQEIAQSTISSIDSSLKQALPQLNDNEYNFISKAVQREVFSILESNYAPGKQLDPNLIEATITNAVESARAFAGNIGNAQIKHNQTKLQIDSGGTPAMPGQKRIDQMSPVEKKEYLARIEDEVNQAMASR